MKKITLILITGLATGLFSFQPTARAEDEMPPAPEAKEIEKKPETTKKQPAPQKTEAKTDAKPDAKANGKGDEEEIDVSDLAEEYWRPQKDDLEVVQNKRFTKTHRVEAALLYAFYQTNQYDDSQGYGVNLAYNFNERWAVEASYITIKNQDSSFLKAIATQYNFRPQHNTEQNETMGYITWAPVYGKFAFIGQKISHFDFYVSVGAGSTSTIEGHFTKGFAIGNRFFIWKNLVLRGEFRIENFTDRILVTQGTAAVSAGGPGYTSDDITRRNLVLGLGWMF